MGGGGNKIKKLYSPPLSCPNIKNNKFLDLGNKEHDWWGEDWDQREPIEGGQTDGWRVGYQVWWGQ